MIKEFKEFNEKYTSDEAKALRDEISEISFSMQYLSIRIKKLEEQLNAKNKEYMEFLGVNDNGETA